MRLSYLFNFLAAVAVVGVLIFGTADSRAAFKLMGASGAVSLSNSREGAAILSGAGLRPGAQSSGSVTIGNPGSSETRLALDVTSEGETAGTGGARIWDTLRISISDGSSVVYEGRVADLGRLTLGALAAGGQRTYAVTATLPSGANDNALQGARLSLRFTWLAESTAPATEPTPDPTQPPVSPPVAPGPTTTTNGDPSATVTAEKLISLPAGEEVRDQADGEVHAAGRREDQVGREHDQRQEGRVGEERQAARAACPAQEGRRSRCRSRRRSPPAARSRSSGPTRPAENKGAWPL